MIQLTWLQPLTDKKITKVLNLCKLIYLMRYNLIRLRLSIEQTNLLQALRLQLLISLTKKKIRKKFPQLRLKNQILEFIQYLASMVGFLFHLKIYFKYCNQLMMKNFFCQKLLSMIHPYFSMPTSSHLAVTISTQLKTTVTFSFLPGTKS